jgi:hypothetical protein
MSGFEMGLVRSCVGVRLRVGVGVGCGITVAALKMSSWGG